MIILDLDNCIADDGWRIQYIGDGPKKYDAYHQLSAFDELCNRGLFHNIGTVIFTGRPDTYAPLTIKWLERKRVQHRFLFMRPEGNFMNNVDLKKLFLQQLFQIDLGGGAISIDDIVWAYDDHPGVIKMYQEQGIKATQVCIHSFRLYGGNNQ